MDLRSAPRWFGTRAVLATLGASFLVAGTAGTAAATLSHKAKHLSLASITFEETNPSGSLPVWIAQQRGYFKQQGLSVNLLTVGSGAPNAIATVLGGTAQIGSVGASSTALSIESGAPLRSVMSINDGIYQELLISQSAAAAHGIPSSVTTPAQARQAITGLKGSHLTIDVNNTTGDGYNAMIYVLNKDGITTSGPGSDVTVAVAGSPAAETAAFLSGKADGFVGSPPTTVQPNAITIPMWLFPTASNATQEIVYTTTSMIQQHPDTVQAAVNAVVEAWSYALTNPKGAVRSLTPMYVAGGITSPEEIQYLSVRNTQKSHAGVTPVVTRSSFNNMVTMVNFAQPKTQLTYPYTDWTVSRFVISAIKKFHLRYPLH